MTQNGESCEGRLHIQGLELHEVPVVVREIEPVDPCARKYEEIGQRCGHTRCPPAIGEPDRALPYRRRNLVVGNQCLLLP